MKIIEGFETQRVLGQYILIATGELSKSFRGLIKLNRTGYEIWEMIKQGYTKNQIVSHLATKYSISETRAQPDVEKIIQQMLKAGIIKLDA